MNNSNRLVQRVGQIMAQLANNGESLGKRLGTAFSTGLNISLRNSAYSFINWRKDS